MRNCFALDTGALVAAPPAYHHGMKRITEEAPSPIIDANSSLVGINITAERSIHNHILSAFNQHKYFEFRSFAN